MTSGLTPEHHRAARVVADALQRAIKSVRGVLGEYEVRFSEAVVAALNGQIDARELSARLRRAILRNAEDAYVEGMKEGGIEDAEEQLDDQDQETITSWIQSQMSYLPNFIESVMQVAALPRGQRTEQQRAILQRVDYWVGALRDLAGMGKASAQRNMMVTWRYGDTDHCDTCLRLNGQRHRLRWFVERGYIPQEKGSATLECGGWRCRCELRDDRGKVVLPA